VAAEPGSVCSRLGRPGFVSDHMTPSLSKKAREYRSHAATARALADAATEPDAKKHYLDIERH